MLYNNENLLIPLIGQRGHFVIAKPFDEIVKDDQVFTVSSIKFIKEYISDNIDVYEFVYKSNGLAEEEYENDKSNDIPIVGLTLDFDRYIYIPARYFKSIPRASGIKYYEKTLAINLGYLPEKELLDGLIGDLKEIIYNKIGIKPSLKIFVTSRGKIVSEDEHNNIEAKRNHANRDKSSIYNRYLKLVNLLDKCKSKVHNLECYLLKKEK